MRFTKGHGTGNDFIVIGDPDGDLALDDATVHRLCDRRTGVGADGVLRAVLTAAVPGQEALAPQARWFMDYRNADGSAVETCGNGIRVFARWLKVQGYVAGEELRLATRDGVKTVWLRPDGAVTVEMGEPRDEALLPDGGVYVSLGNPHVVLFADDLTAAPVATVGRALEREWVGGTNVEFVTMESKTRVGMRVWERGVGETASCGSGACAAAVAAHLRGGTGRDVEVATPGGLLHIEWQQHGPLLLTGPAVLVAEGEVRADWLAGRDPADTEEER